MAESQGSSRPCSWEILCETTATRQVTVEPLIHTTGFYIDIFHHSIFYASLPLAQLEQGRERYVASHESNHFIKWAIRAPKTDTEILCQTIVWTVQSRLFYILCNSVPVISGWYAKEQIRWLFDDNWRIIFVSSPQKICCGYSLESHREAILMGTHNICFYREISKIIP